MNCLFRDVNEDPSQIKNLQAKDMFLFYNLTFLFEREY